MSSSSSNEGNHNLADVLLYAGSKLTRKQAIQEIGDVVLKANMKPKTVKYALDLLKILLPTENTLPSTVDELFGAMLSSENDWRLAQYLIKHKQQPSFLSPSSSLSSPNIWNENSSSTNNSLAMIAAATTSSLSIPPSQELNSIVQSSSLFLPISASNSSSSSSSSSGSSESESESESDSSESDSSEEDDDDDDERNILRALHEAQQQRAINSPPIGLTTQSSIVESNINRVANTNDASDQRSQIVSSSLNRFPFLGSFKRQRSETSSDDSSSEPDVFFSTRLSEHNSDDDDDDDDDDDETPFYPISNNNNNNNKSCCFEMNGCDLLDGGKRRRH